MTFRDLKLNEVYLAKVDSLGYKSPTPIQIDVIPVALTGHDVIAVAPTGTGKTAAFSLPLLQRLEGKPRHDAARPPRALVLTPTRELATQVSQDMRNYAASSATEIISLFGGVSYDSQLSAFMAGVDIVVATPGRLRDHIEKNQIDLLHIEVLVLDEADRMLDMGFLEDVEYIIERLPKERQSLLFSATFSDEIRKVSQRFLKAPKSVNTSRDSIMAPKITHIIHPVDVAQKLPLLLSLLKTAPKQQTLIFTRTKIRADEIAKKITAAGFMCMATHSGRTQAYRTKAMACFKDGRIQILVATDIAARGLDIDHLPLVINYEIPNLAEDYVHRIGRSGRAGMDGTAISLVTESELYLLEPIEALIKKSIPQVWLEGFYPKQFNPRAMKKKNRPRTGKKKSKKWVP